MRRAEYVEPEKRSKQTCQSQFKLGASGALFWKNLPTNWEVSVLLTIKNKSATDISYSREKQGLDETALFTTIFK